MRSSTLINFTIVLVSLCGSAVCDGIYAGGWPLYCGSNKSYLPVGPYYACLQSFDGKITEGPQKDAIIYYNKDNNLQFAVAFQGVGSSASFQTNHLK
ncbi:hypothetical protein, partial [Sporisorium scitamineum]